MSAHTKGNWYVGEKHPTCEVRYVCTDDSEKWPIELAVLYHSQGAEQEANARLMAAAPDMLEALLDCRRALEIANFTGELAVVDAAIRKATEGA